MQEEVDSVLIDSDFKLQEAISSLEHYWRTAKLRRRKLLMQLWAGIKGEREYFLSDELPLTEQGKGTKAV